jgi:hypothetical protein
MLEWLIGADWCWLELGCKWCLNVFERFLQICHGSFGPSRFLDFQSYAQRELRLFFAFAWGFRSWPRAGFWTWASSQPGNLVTHPAADFGHFQNLAVFEFWQCYLYSLILPQILPQNLRCRVETLPGTVDLTRVESSEAWSACSLFGFWFASLNMHIFVLICFHRPKTSSQTS